MPSIIFLSSLSQYPCSSGTSIVMSTLEIKDACIATTTIQKAENVPPSFFFPSVFISPALCLFMMVPVPFAPGATVALLWVGSNKTESSAVRFWKEKKGNTGYDQRWRQI